MLIEENAVVYVTTRSGKRLDNHEAIERENDPSKLDSDRSFDLTAEKFSLTLERVFLIPKCPPVTLLCNCVKTNLIKVWSNKFKATK
jgi:hypothetical protein